MGGFICLGTCGRLLFGKHRVFAPAPTGTLPDGHVSEQTSLRSGLGLRASAQLPLAFSLHTGSLGGFLDQEDASLRGGDASVSLLLPLISPESAVLHVCMCTCTRESQGSVAQ